MEVEMEVGAGRMGASFGGAAGSSNAPCIPGFYFPRTAADTTVESSANTPLPDLLPCHRFYVKTAQVLAAKRELFPEVRSCSGFARFGCLDGEVGEHTCIPHSTSYASL